MICRHGHWFYQQMQRWLKAGCFEEMVHDLRVLRLADEGSIHPAAISIVAPFQSHAQQHRRLRWRQA